jgi:hypothetical protein
MLFLLLSRVGLLGERRKSKVNSLKHLAGRFFVVCFPGSAAAYLPFSRRGIELTHSNRAHAFDGSFAQPCIVERYYLCTAVCRHRALEPTAASVP